MENQNFGIKYMKQFEIIGSWVARIALALIAFFLVRLIQEIDDAKVQMRSNENRLYEIKTDVQVLKTEVGIIKDDVKDLKKVK